MLLIYGTGKVGSAVAHLCEYRGIDYEVRDDSDPPQDYDAYEAIVPSPGVPSHHPIYQTGKVLAELDFAYQFLPKGFQIISVTGTDGKSTTAWMMYSILEKEYFGNKKIYLSGNFDIPFSATVLDILQFGLKKGIIVVEISSFMAYALKGKDQGGFASDYSIFTNFKPDHLNWHKDLQEYLDAKMQITLSTNKKSIMNQQVIDFAEENSLKLDSSLNTRFFTQSMDCFVPRNDEIKDRTNGENIIISGRKKYLLSETHFSGMHNAMNLLAVGLVANEMKICAKRVRNYLREITGLPHRLEKIGEKNGVIYVEDSKSTSSQSLEAALGSYGDTKNLLLIVGGSDKGDSFEYLQSRFESRVKAMACIGATKSHFQKIAEKGNIPYIMTDNLEEAVAWLHGRSLMGDVLMLSPGCASFGLFQDYLDRALQFRSLVQKILD